MILHRLTYRKTIEKPSGQKILYLGDQPGVNGPLVICPIKVKLTISDSNNLRKIVITAMLEILTLINLVELIAPEETPLYRMFILSAVQFLNSDFLFRFN